MFTFEKFQIQMIKHYLKIFVIFSLITNLAFAQQTPIDFSDASHNFSVWGGSTFAIVPSPTDSGNNAGQFFRSDSTGEQGHYIDLTNPIDLDTEDEITLSFYAFDPNNHTIVVKLENGTNPDIEVSQTIASQNMWTPLTFDFATVGGSGTYSRLVIRIDDGSAVPGAFLIDDIDDGSEFVDPNELDVIYTDLVWSDEFDVDGPVDPTKWFHQIQLPAGGSWFNGEEQHYTNRIENSFVQGGFLNIVAIAETYTDQGETKQYTSARLNSKFAFTYGRVDVMAQLPSGNGTWPAIWTLGKNINEAGAYWQEQGFGTTSWPACGEIDIMEHGLGAVNHVSSAIHTPSSFGATVNTASQAISDVATNFHKYSVNWSPNQITFLIDDVAYYTYNPAVKNASTWPFDLDQYLLLNIAMGGFAGTIDPGFTQSPMIIDYVRVYQNTLGTDEFNTSSFNIYPNPTTDKIFINTQHTISKVEVYDAVGKLVINQNSPQKEINVSALTAGLYFVKMYNGTYSEVKKLIKQ